MSSHIGLDWFVVNGQVWIGLSSMVNGRQWSMVNGGRLLEARCEARMCEARCVVFGLGCLFSPFVRDSKSFLNPKSFLNS